MSQAFWQLIASCLRPSLPMASSVGGYLGRIHPKPIAIKDGLFDDAGAISTPIGQQFHFPVLHHIYQTQIITMLSTKSTLLLAFLVCVFVVGVSATYYGGYGYGLGGYGYGYSGKYYGYPSYYRSYYPYYKSYYYYPRYYKTGYYSYSPYYSHYSKGKSTHKRGFLSSNSVDYSTIRLLWIRRVLLRLMMATFDPRDMVLAPKITRAFL